MQLNIQKYSSLQGMNHNQTMFLKFSFNCVFLAKHMDEDPQVHESFSRSKSLFRDRKKKCFLCPQIFGQFVGGVNTHLSFSPWQLHLQTKLHQTGPVGDRLCHRWRQHPADHPPQQTPLPGPYWWLQRRLVCRITPSLSFDRAVGSCIDWLC